MILNALYDLYGRLEEDQGYGIAPPGRSYQRVTFVVVLEPDGKLFTIQDARVRTSHGMAAKRMLVLGLPKPSGSALHPRFLWDNAAYMLGWDPKKPRRANEAFQAFRAYHLEFEAGIGVPEYSAVCRFLEQWQPERAADYKELLETLGGGFGVFQIRGQLGYVHEHPRIQRWWNAAASKPTELPLGQCLVTGESGPIARLHPKIKGVAGTQSTGATIAGFNENAYWSFGLEQSHNAPVSEEAARRYTAALNALLDGPRREKHRLVVGGTTVAFWTDRPSMTEDIFLQFLGHGSEGMGDSSAQDESLRTKLETFLRALRSGKEVSAGLGADSERTHYFILGLGPNAARIAVRFFHHDSISRLLENLHRHFLHIGVERQYSESSKRPDPEFPSLWLLLRQTARKSEEIPPVLAGPFLDAIVTGARYPEGLYQAVMRRITADRIISYPRACIIKGYLVRNLGKEVPVSLDTTRNDTAYRLGRLFAALEKTQQDALGGSLNATIRDRFYSSASATPGAVFPRLLRTYQHHLSKLEGGRKVNREKLVQEILDPLEGFPAHLGLADQGLFALGYYHQMNDFYRSKTDSNGAREA